MNKKEKDNLMKEAEAAIGKIKAKCEHEVIEYYDIVPLKDKNACYEIGIGVQMALNTNYCYTAKTLNKWKLKLKATDFIISEKYKSLYVTFIMVYDKYARKDIYQLLR